MQCKTASKTEKRKKFVIFEYVTGKGNLIIYAMKKILFLCLMATCVVSCNNSGNTENQTPERIIQTTTMENPRFKMIETENIHILLKWDTRTGKTWMVQYGLSDTPALEKLIPNSQFLTEDKSWNGRFELYPTQNMFNFIMVDTYNGNTYQVQWSTDDEHCFATSITSKMGN